MIVGVAEPIVLIYGYMYKFAKKQDDLPFLPWCSIVLIYTGILQMVIASVNWCDAVHRITRFSGEIFGLLIAGLFLQQAITGLVQEFDQIEYPVYAWRVVNGLWSLFLACGLLYTALMLTAARDWRFFNSGIRRWLSDYGSALMVVVWTGVSYILTDAPNGIPRRVVAPDLWDNNNNGNWSVLSELGDVPGKHWASAIVPAIIIVVLFYFDHNVSAQLASSGDMGVKKPKAFHYDFLIAGITNLLMGFLGLPPTNGVLPQSPMHTRSLIYKIKANAKKKDSIVNVISGRAKSLKRAITKTIAGDFGSPKTAAQTVPDADQSSAESQVGGVAFDCAETRVTNLEQSLFVFVCMFLTVCIRWIPRSVLWGYFAYMSIESLPGNQLWDRALLIFTDPRRYGRGAPGQEQTQHLFIRTVKFRTIFLFTAMQLALLALLWGITQTGTFGVTFPLFIMSLVPFREFVMPKLFLQADLEELDSPEAIDEVAADPAPPDPPSMLFGGAEDERGDGEACDGEESLDGADSGNQDNYYATGEFTGRSGHQIQKVATKRTAARRLDRHKEAVAEQEVQRQREMDQIRSAAAAAIPPFGATPRQRRRRDRESSVELGTTPENAGTSNADSSGGPDKSESRADGAV